MSFIERIERNLKGVQFFSVGCCPGCDECPENGEDEGSFSWSECDSCGTRLGGDRHAAHGVIASTIEEAQRPDRSIEHFSVCVDCLLFHANGDMPEGEDA